MRKILNVINWIILGCLLVIIIIYITGFVKIRSSPVNTNSSFVNINSFKQSETVTSDAVENRCGWFVNPTPGNAWLLDKEAKWIISVDGGHQAEGEYPDYSGKQWVKTNGMYGYGCACMQVITNHQGNEVTAIKSANALPLATCRKDHSLKEPQN